MNLIEKLEAAIAAKDKSQAEVLEAQAQQELGPLKASGQKNYVAIVNNLLVELKSLPESAPVAPPKLPESYKEQFAKIPDARPKVHVLDPSAKARIDFED